MTQLNQSEPNSTYKEIERPFLLNSYETQKQLTVTQWGWNSDKNGNIESRLQLIDAKIESSGVSKEQEQVPYRKILLTQASTGDKVYMYIGFASAIGCGLGLPSFVFLFGDIADSFKPNEPPDATLDSIKRTSKILTFLGLAVWFCSYIFFTFLIIASERIGQKTKIRYLQQILRQDIGWFDQNNTSELSSRLGKECQAIQRAIGEKIGTIVMAFAMSLSGLFFAFFKGAYFSALLMCYFPIMFGMSYFITVSFSKGFKDNMKAYGQSAGYADQALNAIRVVFAFGQEKTEIRNYEKYLNRAKKTGIKTHLMGALAIGGFFLSLYGYYSYSFYVGSFMVTKQVTNVNSGVAYTSGDIMACFLGVIYGIFSLGLATPNFKALSEGQVAGKYAYDIIERKPAIELDNPKGKTATDLKGKIEFKNVSFSYPSRRDQKILDNFSATIQEGKTTALVGASGSGKSTVVQLIERFYDPEQGQVLVDGVDLKGLNLRDFRRHVGYVGQEPVLFNMTIKENLLYGNPHASDEQVVQALKSANAWDFIQDKMQEKGIDTNVGNAGGQLSGGQKQRLAIARAFIKKPKILLLDEATSALDKKNEKEVQAAIDKIRQELGGSITTVVIAHRLSTIKQADNIIVMKKGKIVEEGSHDQLLKSHPEGTYSKFVREQEQAETQNPSDTPQGNTSLPNQEEEEILEEKAEGQQKYIKSSFRTSSMSNKKLEAKEEEMKKHIDEKDAIRDQKDKDMISAQSKKSQFKRLLEYNRPQVNVFIGIFMSMLQGALMPIFGGVMAKMLFVLMDVFDLQEVRHQTNYWCGLMLIFSFCALITGFSQKFAFGVIGENVTQNIRMTLYKKIVEKHLGWFDVRENAPGVLTTTLSSDAQIINGVSTEGLSSSVDALFAVLTGVIIGFIFSWKMSLVCMACVPFLVVSGYMGAQFQQGLSVEGDESQNFANILAGDAIINYRTVASFANEDQLISDYSNLLEGPKQRAVRQAHKIGAVYGLSQFAIYGAIATLFYAGAEFLVHYGDNPIHMFISIFAMMFGALESGQAQQFGPDIGRAKVAAKKIFGIIDQPSQISALNWQKEEKSISPDDYKGDIEFQNVWFRYPTRRNDWVLKGLNLKIKPNETVALVGESGCGKSTIVSLLMRFYDVDFGTITLDGVDIRKYNLHNLRELMGLVMQEPTLFNYTIYENILYGDLNASNSKIQEAAQIANAIEFIDSQNNLDLFEDSSDSLLTFLNENKKEITNLLGQKQFELKRKYIRQIAKEEEKKGDFLAVEGDIDNRSQDKIDATLQPGFRTECGLRGSKLSGGQKQRIAIARAIIRKPKILILDEATSALDEESQKKVQVALDNIMQNRTSIVIAHRLSTVEKCDRVIVLEGGVLVEEGKFNALKNKEGGFFSQLATGMQYHNIPKKN